MQTDCDSLVILSFFNCLLKVVVYEIRVRLLGYIIYSLLLSTSLRREGPKIIIKGDESLFVTVLIEISYLTNQN